MNFICATKTVPIPTSHKIQKSRKQNTVNIHKLYQLFMKNFLCQTVPKSSFYILTKRLTT